MGQFREIRLRLNLRQQRDQWLAGALDQAADELGAPLASIVRRALTAYLRDRGTSSTPAAPPSGSASGTPTTLPGARRETGGEAPATSRSTNGADPEQQPGDGSTEFVDALVLIGTPPDPRATTS